jgi:hypothetical protein
MIVLSRGKVVFFDVDDTMILPPWRLTITPSTNALRDELVFVTDPHDGSRSAHLPHRRHIDRLKQHHANGDGVVVWSQGGAGWCEAVVKALGLESHVDLCITKPNVCYDDLAISSFCQRLWLSPWGTDDE